jgi:predicted S18 family serine protease
MKKLLLSLLILLVCLSSVFARTPEEWSTFVNEQVKIVTVQGEIKTGHINAIIMMTRDEDVMYFICLQEPGQIKETYISGRMVETIGIIQQRVK